MNSKIPESESRVHFCNKAYVADGPSNVPAFSLINEKGEATLAVYPKGSDKAFAQVDKLRRDDRVQMIADTAKALLPYFGSCGANDRMHQQLSSLSRLQSNKNRGTCLRDLDECRAVAVELSDLAGKAYEAFELQKRADKLTGKIVK